MPKPRIHPLELRPIAGYSRPVHAGAFARAVETVMNFDKVDAAEAAKRLMSDLESGTIALKVEQGFAAYQFKRPPAA